MSSSEKRSLGDKWKSWKNEHIGSLKTTVALGMIAASAAGIAGCGGPSNASADHAPTTIGGTATPGPSETTTPTTPETTASPDTYTLNLESSDIYKSLTPAQQETVVKLSKMSLAEFSNPDVVSNEDRALFGAAAADANSADYLNKLSQVHLDGQPGLLGSIAQENYIWSIGKGVEKITTGDNYGPASQVTFRRGIAYNMAKTGDKKELDMAIRIYITTVYINTTVGANDPNHGDLKNKIDELKEISATKSDPKGATLHYGLIGTDRSNLDGMPKTVSVGFNVWDPNSSTSVPGTDLDGKVACAYQLTTFSPKRIIAQEYACDSADGSTNNVIGSLRPNTP